MKFLFMVKVDSVVPVHLNKLLAVFISWVTIFIIAILPC